MKKKRLRGYFALLVFSLILFVILSSFAGALINVTSPRNYTNYSNWVLFNVSYTNGTDFTDATNATFYYNLSGVWVVIRNASVCHAPVGGGVTSCYANLSIQNLNLTDGKFSINATLANTSGGISYLLYGATSIARMVTFDKTPPNVSSSLVGVSNNGNYTGTLVLNISINDVTIGISSVYFNLTYPNGSALTYIRGTASGDYYNFSVDTTSLSDGRYNITILANDTLNNLNNSVKFYLTFDKTSPTGSLSCSPSQVHKDDTVTCSCWGSDETSGVSSYVYNSNPSTGQTGTFIQSCIITDYVGNFLMATGTYNVERIGTGTIKPKPIPIPSQTVAEVKINKTQSWGKIIPGVVEIMKDFNVDIGVKQIEIEVKNEANNVEVSVIKYNSKPANVSVSKTNTYKYLQVKEENLEQSLDKATMTIQVEKSWALANNLNKEDIALFKYDEASQTWSELKTTFKEEDSIYYYYDTELKGFSYFAIASKEIIPIGSWIWIVLSIIIVLILFFLVMKKTKLGKFFRLKK